MRFVLLLLLVYLCPSTTDRRRQGAEMHVAQVQNGAEAAEEFGASFCRDIERLEGLYEVRESWNNTPCIWMSKGNRSHTQSHDKHNTTIDFFIYIQKSSVRVSADTSNVARAFTKSENPERNRPHTQPPPQYNTITIYLLFLLRRIRCESLQKRRTSQAFTKSENPATHMHTRIRETDHYTQTCMCMPTLFFLRRARYEFLRRHLMSPAPSRNRRILKHAHTNKRRGSWSTPHTPKYTCMDLYLYFVFELGTSLFRDIKCLERVNAVGEPCNTQVRVNPCVLDMFGLTFP